MGCIGNDQNYRKITSVTQILGSHNKLSAQSLKIISNNESYVGYGSISVGQVVKAQHGLGGGRSETKKD